MSRWDINNNEQVAETPEVDAFIADIVEVCKKHNMSIGHEDGHGSFIIEKFCKFNIAWLQKASTETIPKRPQSDVGQWIGLTLESIADQK